MLKQFLCILTIGIICTLASAGADNKVVVVEKGDTLYSIGREYNVSVQSLIRANGIVNPKALKAGMEIEVPHTYIVEKGDTLYGIARRNSFSVDELRRINGIKKGSIIKVGQIIQLPASSTQEFDSQDFDSQDFDSGDRADTTKLAGREEDDAGTHDEESAGKDVASGNNSTKHPTNQATGKADSSTTSYQELVDGKDVLWPHTGLRTKLNGKLKGTQITGSRGDQVVSVSSGKVVWVAPYRGYGTLVMVESSRGLIYAYGGNEATYVEVGDKVKAGSVLGRLGINPIEKTAKVFFFVYKNGKPVDPATAPRG